MTFSFFHSRRNVLIALGGVALLVALLAAATLMRMKSTTPEKPNDLGNVITVAPSSTLKMSFPALMDHKSVERNVSVPRKLTGELSWNEEVLIFTPDAPLNAGERYTFTVSKKTKTIDGTTLDRPLTFTFAVSSGPIISAHIPSMNATVATNAKITIIFDRSMVPLTQVQGERAESIWKTWPVKIAPPVKGSWRWLGTSAVEFMPEAGFDPSTKYTVTVPKGMKSIVGELMEQEYSWTFSTTPPAILSVVPAQGSVLRPKDSIQLHFNQDIDIKTAESAISLQQRPGMTPMNANVPTYNSYEQIGMDLPMIKKDDLPIGKFSPVSISLKYGTKEDPKGKKVLDESTIVIMPSAPLPLDHTFAIIVKESLRGKRGSLAPTESAQMAFSTAGAFRVEDIHRQYDSLTIDFTNDVNVETIKKYISITPVPKNWKDTLLEVYDNRKAMKRINIPLTLAPSTTYKVVVSKNLRDIYDQSLPKDVHHSFTTDQLSPSVVIESKGEFGFFEKDKPPVYNIKTLNVKTITAKVAKVPFDKFLSMRLENLQNYQSVPDMKALPGYQEWNIPVKQHKNAWNIIPFDVQNKYGSTLEPSIYALTVESPEYLMYNRNDPVILSQYFAVTDIALTLKHTSNRTLLWAVNMKTGKPVEGAVVRYFSLKNEQVLTGTTDHQGFFESEIDIGKFRNNSQEYDAQFYVTVEKDGDFSFVGCAWSDGIRPYDFEGITQEYRSIFEISDRTLSHLYTERPIYRTGDTVSFKGILRTLDVKGKLSIPSKKTMEIVATDANGKEIYRKKLPLSAFGTFSGTIPIDKNAPLGSYTIATAENTEQYYNYPNTSFSVLAYRKPEYRVEVTPERENYVTGETIAADVTGAYYFGAPMVGADVQWSVMSTDYYFNKFTEGWYSFNPDGIWCWWGDCDSETDIVTQGKGKLDATGKLRITLPANIAEKIRSQVYTLNVTVSDANNQVVTNNASVIVHKATTYVGVTREDYIVDPGGTVKMKVVTVDVDGNRKPQQAVKMKVLSVKWNTVKKKGVDGEFYFNNEATETFVRELSTITDEGGRATVEFALKDGGEYRVVATVGDGGGKVNAASESIYVWSDMYVNWPHTNNDRIAIVSDKREYAVGDTAHLLVKTPYQGKGVKALITVERENILTKEIVDVTSSAMKFEVPITDDLLPNAYVSVMIIKPRIGETFDDEGRDTGRPGFKMGYVKLNVETKKKALSIDITTDKKKYAPGETVNVTLSTKDWQGKPVKAELSLGVVDMSVLALSGYQKPDLLSAFFSSRALGVRTSNLLMYLIDRYKPGSKGGGGGGFEETTRSKFNDTAYWNPAITTNEDGQARVSFTLPDSLTTWQLLAVGSTQDNLVGAEDTTIVETKQVVLRPVRPRFAIVGDTLSLAALVHNYTDEKRTFTVSLQGKGFSQVGEATSQVTIAAGEQAKVPFTAKVLPGQSLTLRFAAKAEGVKDEIVETIPVFPFGVLQSVATTNVTDTASVEKILVPTASDAAYGTLDVSISPTIASFLPSGLAYVSDYPYGCAEQVMSSLLPNVALSTLQQFKAFKIVSDSDLDKRVTAGIQKLYSAQKFDGGFGYWEQSERSYPYLSAYVLYGMQRAKKAGFAVDAEVISRVKKYLDESLRTNAVLDQTNSATRAYVLYVLSEDGITDASLLQNAYDNREKLPAFSRAHLAMAFWNEGSSGSKKKARELMTSIMDHAMNVDTRGAHIEENAPATYGELMQTNTTSTAIALQALTRIDPKHPLAPSIVRYLLNIRNEGHWDTTQSTSQSLLALIDYLKSTKELDANMQSTVSVAGKAVIDKRFNEKNVLTREKKVVSIDALARGKETEIAIKKEGRGRVYYDVLMSYFYTPDTVVAVDRGMTITRRIEPMFGSQKKPAVGSTYKVTLTMTAPVDRHFVAVESPLPSGMEAIDFALKTSDKTLQSEVNGGKTYGGQMSKYWWFDSYFTDSLRRFTHIEFRDDQVFMFADHLPAGVYEYSYLVRATLPGTFRERPAKMWEMYTPETFGQTEGGWMTISDSKQ